MSELDKDFDSIAAQINKKLQEATSALKEVNKLREKAGLDSLIFSQWIREEAYRKIYHEVNESEESENPDFDEDEVIESRMEELSAKYDAFDTSPLERELNQAGWSTSSSYC